MVLVAFFGQFKSRVFDLRLCSSMTVLFNVDWLQVGLMFLSWDKAGAVLPG